jgi:hypothetical protein
VSNEEVPREEIPTATTTTSLPPTTTSSSPVTTTRNTVTFPTRRQSWRLAASASVALLALIPPEAAFGAGDGPITTATTTATTTTTTTTTPVTPKQVLSRFGSVPTFALTTEDGVPFMVFNGRDGATGYFFLSYDAAVRALADARKRDASRTATTATVWDVATVRVVPMSVAIRLSLVGTARTASNPEDGVRDRRLPSTIGDLVPSEEAVADARRVDGRTGGANPDRWDAKGRVPIFYTEARRDRWYFNVADLKRDDADAAADENDGTIRVAEMMDVFRKTKDWDTLRNVVPVPVRESNQVAAQLIRDLPPDARPYDLQRAYLVSSAR